MFVPGSLLVVWLSSVAQSYATRDASNKDYVCKPTIPAGINRPPPSETILHVTRVPDHKKIFFGAVINVASTRFKADEGIMDALVHLREKRGAGGREEATAGESVLATWSCARRLVSPYYFEKIPKNDTGVLRTESKETQHRGEQQQGLTQSDPRHPILNTK